MELTQEQVDKLRGFVNKYNNAVSSDYDCCYLLYLGSDIVEYLGEILNGNKK